MKASEKEGMVEFEELAETAMFEMKMNYRTTLEPLRVKILGDLQNAFRAQLTAWKEMLINNQGFSEEDAEKSVMRMYEYIYNNFFIPQYNESSEVMVDLVKNLIPTDLLSKNSPVTDILSILLGGDKRTQNKQGKRATIFKMPISKVAGNA